MFKSYLFFTVLLLVLIFTIFSFQTTIPACGNGICEVREYSSTCPVDCGDGFEGCRSDSACDDNNVLTTDSCVKGVCENLIISDNDDSHTENNNLANLVGKNYEVKRNYLPEKLIVDIVKIKNLNDILLKQPVQQFAPTSVNNQNVNQNENLLVSEALERKKLMLELIDKRPDLFLSFHIPNEQQKNLPDNVLKNVEKEVTMKGILEVMENPHNHEPDAAVSSDENTFNYFLRDGSKNYALRFADGSLPKEISGTEVKVNGVSLDNYLATSSAKSSAFQATAVPRRDENFGVQKIAIILTKEKGTNDSEIPLLEQNMQKANYYYKEVSYGQASLEWDVYGWYESDTNDYLAADSDVDFSKYLRVISVDERNCFACATVGSWAQDTDDGTFNISVSWLTPINFQKDYYFGIVAHEFGHNLGVSHSNNLECGDKPIDYFNSCYTYEYGDSYDVMGDSYKAGHIDSIYKEIITWINDDNIIDVNSNGVYTINSYETLTDATVLKVPRKIDENGSVTDFYYVEYRTPIGFDSFVNETQPDNGPQVRIFEYIKNGPGFSPSQLIDMTPGNYPYNEGISQGKTFFDPKTNVKIKTLSITQNSATVEVMFDDDGCVRNDPTLVIFPEEVNTTTNESLYYSFKLTNNDEGICSDREIYYSFDEFPFGNFRIEVPNTWVSTSSKEPSVLGSGESLIGNVVGDINNADVGEYKINLNIFDIEKGVYASKEIPFNIVESKVVNDCDVITVGINNNYAAYCGDANYNSSFDVNGDKVVNINDLNEVNSHYNDSNWCYNKLVNAIDACTETTDPVICIECRAPPFGCHYDGASCSTCGTLVSNDGGECSEELELG